MGLCSSSAAHVQELARADAAVYAVSKQVDEALGKEKEEKKWISKILLLGAGESGKSTFFKQMRVKYGEGFSRENLKAMRGVIHANVIKNIKTMIVAAESLARKGIPDTKILPEHSEIANAIKAYEEDEKVWVDEKLAAEISAVWLSQPLQNTWDHRNLFAVSDSAGYFLDRAKDIGSDDYIPIEQDIFRVRVRTRGIVEESFKIEGSEINVFDVGGQRSERKGWVRAFANVTAILFIAALSEYDMVLEEAPDTNRMQESLDLFEDTCNSRYFRDTHMILFLNKRDLFEEKLRLARLSTFFPEYKGNNDFDSASLFLRKKFEERNRNPKKYIYTHFTCATDTRSCKIVFDAVAHIVLSKNVEALV